MSPPRPLPFTTLSMTSNWTSAAANTPAVRYLAHHRHVPSGLALTRSARWTRLRDEPHATDAGGMNLNDDRRTDLASQGHEPSRVVPVDEARCRPYWRYFGPLPVD